MIQISIQQDPTAVYFFLFSIYIRPLPTRLHATTCKR